MPDALLLALAQCQPSTHSVRTVLQLHAPAEMSRAPFKQVCENARWQNAVGQSLLLCSAASYLSTGLHTLQAKQLVQCLLEPPSFSSEEEEDAMVLHSGMASWKGGPAGSKVLTPEKRRCVVLA